MTKDRYHPYARPANFRTTHRPLRGVRQHRKAHFSFDLVHHTMDVDGAGDAKRHKNAEARLIPGVDGVKTFGFPNTIITKMRYVDYYTMSSASGSVAKQVMVANGLFDPDLTGTGHQPMYFDEYKAIYNNYTVIGSKVTVHFSNYSTQASWNVGIVGDDEGTTSTAATTLMEYNNSVWTVLGQRDGGHNIKVLTATFEPLEQLGVDAKDDGWTAINTGANPDNKYYFSIWGNTNDNSSASMVATVEVEYTAKFSELRSPTAS